jgi:single-strand DNA-binding protein
MNHCIFTGRLTADPEIKEVGEHRVLRFAIAVNDSFTKEAVYPEFEAWNGTAEKIEQYFKKGKLIRVYGRLVADKWQADDGTNRTKLYFKLDRFEFPETNNSDRAASDQEGGTPPANRKAEAVSTETKKTRGRPKKEKVTSPPEIEDNDDEEEVLF